MNIVSTMSLPIYWVQEFKTKNNKTHLVSLNWYRNAHYHSQNKMKKDYHELVYKQIKTLKPINTFLLDIQLYYKNPSCDGANVVPMIEKFTLDALQEQKIINNDNVKCHLGTSWKVVRQDKEDPRCIINIIKGE